MMIHHLTREQLCGIRTLLGQLDDKKLAAPLKVLDNATLGMHLRHIVEFYQCLFAGLKNGKVDYDLRKRDHEMEVSRDYCKQCVDALLKELEGLPSELSLELSSTYEYEEKEVKISIPTTYYRELMYNMEHCIHHLAIIKIGMRSLGDDSLKVDENMGVAASTLKNRKSCAP